MGRRIASNLLLSGGKFLRNGVVDFDDQGVITALRHGLSHDEIDRMAGVEFYSGIMVAGFVNTHCHTELSYLKGAIESGGGFAKFAASLGALRCKFNDEERQSAITKAEAEMVSEGIAAVGDIVNGESSFAMKSRSKIAFRNFAELFGLRATDTSAVDGLPDLPNTTITPHSIYSLNDALFRQAASGSTIVPLSIHFMESEAEASLFRGEGALHEWYQAVGFECDFLGYGSPAERLVASVPSDRSVILVHNCCVTERDIELIHSHFTAPVYWAICPRSNRYISGSTPPVQLLRRMGARLCIGTDSLASNWSLSMLDELRELPEVPLAERLDWATRGGANALYFNHLGDIAIGKSPRINILSGVDYATMQLSATSRVTPLF